MNQISAPVLLWRWVLLDDTISDSTEPADTDFQPGVRGLRRTDCSWRFSTGFLLSHVRTSWIYAQAVRPPYRQDPGSWSGYLSIMIETIRTNSSNPDFVLLVEALDADLAERDGEDHGYYAQFNAIDAIQHVIVLYEGEKAVSCGAMKAFEENAMEIKRMYTLPAHRGKGFAGKILKELETWALELGIRTTVLETGKRQPEAIRLYEKHGYEQTPNYGQYIGVDNSVCFRKALD